MKSVDYDEILQAMVLAYYQVEDCSLNRNNFQGLKSVMYCDSEVQNIQMFLLN